MKRYSFTGPVDLSALEEAFVVETVRALVDGSEFTTGAAPGVDTVTCLAALATFPDAKHRIVVPAAPHNEALIARLRADHPNVIIELMPAILKPGTKAADAYRARNERLVDYCVDGTLIGFPRGTTVRGSGTRMTLNIAKRRRVNLIEHRLDYLKDPR